MTPEISLPKEAKKIYSYDTLTEHMWFWFYKMLFCRQRNNLTTTGRTLAYIFIVKKTDKFLAGYGDLFPKPLVFVIFSGKSNCRFCHVFDTVVADSNPVGVFSKVSDDRFGTVKWFLAIRNPFLCIASI